MSAPVKTLGRKKRFGKANAVRLVLALVFILVVFLPLIRMFSYMDIDSVRKVIGSPSFSTAVRNSVVSALLGTLVTVLVAALLAFCVHRTQIRFKSIFEIIFST